MHIAHYVYTPRCMLGLIVYVLVQRWVWTYRSTHMSVWVATCCLAHMLALTHCLAHTP